MPLKRLWRAVRPFLHTTRRVKRTRRLTVPYSRALAAARRGARRKPYPKGVTQKGVVKAILRARRKRGTLHTPRVGKVSPKLLGLATQTARRRLAILRALRKSPFGVTLSRRRRR